jgi:hypothetical protein
MKASQERLYADIAFLSGIRPYRNYRNPESLNRAADHISLEFKKAGLEPEEQKWMAKGMEYRTVGPVELQGIRLQGGDDKRHLFFEEQKLP